MQIKNNKIILDVRLDELNYELGYTQIYFACLKSLSIIFFQPFHPPFRTLMK